MRTGSRSVAVALVCALGLSCCSRALAVVTYTIPGDPVPSSIGAGDVLNLNGGGVLPAFFTAAAGSTVNVQGGTTDPFFHSSGTVNVHSGAIGIGALFDNGCNLSVYGGSVGQAWTMTNSQANVSGGTLGPTSFSNIQGSTFRMSGGSFQPGAFLVDFENVVEWSGGMLANQAILMGIQGTAKVTGTSFLLDGSPIPGLTPGSTVTFNSPMTATITGTLLDGNSLTVNLQPTYNGQPTHWQVSVTLVPEPASALLPPFAVLLLRRRRAVRCR